MVRREYLKIYVLIIKTKKHGGPGRFDNWITFGRQKALIDTQLLIQI